MEAISVHLRLLAVRRRLPQVTHSSPIACPGTSPHQAGPSQQAHGEAGCHHSNGEHHGANRPVVPHEVCVADPERPGGYDTERKGEPGLPPTRSRLRARCQCWGPPRRHDSQYAAARLQWWPRSLIDGAKETSGRKNPSRARMAEAARRPPVLDASTALHASQGRELRVSPSVGMSVARPAMRSATILLLPHAMVKPMWPWPML